MSNFARENKRTHGFTLIELLVVIAVIGILASLLLPTLATSKQRAQGSKCMNNLHQMTLGWLMYNTDSRGKVMPNCGEDRQPTGPDDPRLNPGGSLIQWCPGREDEVEGCGPDGLELISKGLLFPYVSQSYAVYKCPSDFSSYPFTGEGIPRVRSVSMNCWIGPLTNAEFDSFEQPHSPDQQPRAYRKDSDLTVPGPANTFLFVDENPYSINDGWMVEDPLVGKWVDAPASYHTQRSAVTFTDGHAMFKVWHDPAILSPASLIPWANIYPVAPVQDPARDYQWLVSRATAAVTNTQFQGPP